MLYSVENNSEEVSTMIDMHCHLDFSPDPQCLAHDLAKRGAVLLCNTVTPRGYERACDLFRECGNVSVGLGLHPWWIASGRCGESDIAVFEQRVSSVSYVGEVGLDLSPRCVRSGAPAGCGVQPHAAFADPGCLDSRAAQVAAFGRVVRACFSSATLRLVSLHAVRAETVVLDMLERAREEFSATSSAAWVFHGFGGSQKDLQRALDFGCYVSVGPRMMRTKRGRAYARSIPEKRILIETDLPSRENEPIDACAMQHAWEETLDAVMAERGVEERMRDQWARCVHERSLQLLGCAEMPRH